MNKYKLYMILGIIVLVLSVSGTLAYYIWSSTSNAIVNFDVCTPTVTFVGGSTINGVDMIPVLTKDNGTIKNIEVKKNSTCNRDVTMNLYLELATFPTELAESSFVYELYKNSGTSPVIKGNFSGRKEGDTITLLSNQILNTSKDTYTLYIYIDGTQDNPGTMAGKNFLFKLWGSGEGAIYKENVMTTSDNATSSTSKFFNTEVMREEIQSLTIAEDNTVPDTEGVVSKDISSNKDETVMLWYIPEEVTSSDGTTKTMYDVWIGGKNGILQTGTNASNMFAYLTNVEKLDLSKLDTSYATNMSRMFYMSSGLKTIDLSNFNTSNVTNMYGMFWRCTNLTSLDVSSFNTSKVTTMQHMFYDCKSLLSLDLSMFDTKNVNNMSSMFYRNTSLMVLNLNGFDTSNVTDMQTMFGLCSSLKNVNLNSFNTSKVTNMLGMFSGCSSLINLSVSSFNTSKVTNMGSMFNGCSSLTNLNVSNFDTSKVTDMGGMFSGCSKLTNIDISNFDTSKVTSMGGMFSYCSSLTNLDLSNFNTSNVKSMENMFRNCDSLKSLNLSNFNTSNVTSMRQMFNYTNFQDGLDLSSFDTSKVTDMNMMFAGSSVTKLDLSSFNTSKVTNMNIMFYFCGNLEKIYVSDLWDVSNVTTSSYIFHGNWKLVGAVPFDSTKRGLDMANYTTGYLTYKSNN